MRSLSLALVMLVPSWSWAKLEIRDVQASHGQLGPERTRTSYFPGDEVYFRYTVAGVRLDPDGRTRAEIRMTVTDAKGNRKLRFESPIQNLMPLGGDTLPGNAQFDLEREDFPPGEYELTVVVTDLLSRETVSFHRKITCTPVEFALVRIRCTHDRDGFVPARVGGLVGQALYIRMQAVGFDRSNDVIDVEMVIEILDAAGRGVLPKPMRAVVHNEKPSEVKKTETIHLSGTIGLNRSGEFKLKITVTDKHNGNVVRFEAPLRVESP